MILFCFDPHTKHKINMWIDSPQYSPVVYRTNPFFFEIQPYHFFFVVSPVSTFCQITIEAFFWMVVCGGSMNEQWYSSYGNGVVEDVVWHGQNEGFDPLVKSAISTTPVFLLSHDRDCGLSILNALKGTGVTLHESPLDQSSNQKNKGPSVWFVTSLAADEKLLSTVKHIKTNHLRSEIILMTEDHTPAFYSKLMRIGVFEVIPFNVSKEFIRKTVFEAIQGVTDISFCDDKTDVDQRELRRKVDWLLYKDSRRNIEDSLSGREAIEHLRNSLSQGAGIGLILSLIDLLESQSSKSGESITIPESIVRLFLQNGNVARTHLQGLEHLVNIMSRDFKLEMGSTPDIIDICISATESLESFFKKKNLAIFHPDFARNVKISIDKEMIQLAIEELLINAYKYAHVGSKIDIYLSYPDGYLCIGIKNQLDSDLKKLHISEIEDKIIQPFYRLAPPVEDVIQHEKFGLGLGLTAVNHIATRHNGLFSFSQVVDYTENNAKQGVLVRMFLPIQ